MGTNQVVERRVGVTRRLSLGVGLLVALGSVLAPAAGVAARTGTPTPTDTPTPAPTIDLAPQVLRELTEPTLQARLSFRVRDMRGMGLLLDGRPVADLTPRTAVEHRGVVLVSGPEALAFVAAADGQWAAATYEQDDVRLARHSWKPSGWHASDGDAWDASGVVRLHELLASATDATPIESPGGPEEHWYSVRTSLAAGPGITWEQPDDLPPAGESGATLEVRTDSHGVPQEGRLAAWWQTEDAGGLLEARILQTDFEVAREPVDLDVTPILGEWTPRRGWSGLDRRTTRRAGLRYGVPGGWTANWMGSQGMLLLFGLEGDRTISLVAAPVRLTGVMRAGFDMTTPREMMLSFLGEEGLEMPEGAVIEPFTLAGVDGLIAPVTYEGSEVVLAGARPRKDLFLYVFGLSDPSAGLLDRFVLEQLLETVEPVKRK